MSNLLLYAVVGIVLLATLGGIAYELDHKGYRRGVAEIKGLWEEANRKQAEKDAAQAAEASQKAEVAREKQKVVYRTITQQVDRIVEKPVYRDRECFDADGLRVTNAALNGGAPAPAGKPDAAVPAALPAGGRPGGDGAAKDR